MNIFLNNKYTITYFRLINRYKNPSSTAQCEVHHIIPRSLNGTNDESNLVALPLRVHMLCHLLLIKMTSGKAQRKMIYSANLMSNTRAITSNQYAIAKSAYYEMLKDPEYKLILSIIRKNAWTIEARQKMSMFQTLHWKNDDHRSKMSALSKSMWSDPEFKTKMIDIHKKRCSDPNFKHQKSLFFKNLWQNLEYRTKMSIAISQMWKNDEYKAKKLQRLSECWNDEAYQLNQTAKQKAIWADPEKRAIRIKNQTASWTPERRAKFSASIKAARARGAYKQKTNPSS